jgi:SAM-dependent methyltransferase
MLDEKPAFYADCKYTDRETKARYVWLKYGSLLEGRILDVGADQCYLKRFLSPDAEYWGIGLGGQPDQEVDLEAGGIPFSDGAYDCVICLDVLEHLENIHETLDELCRVSKHYVIISLPNPWAEFWHMLRSGEYKPGQPMKFYGLPLEPPVDRHKWFFSCAEARRFVLHRAEKNGMRVVQMDVYGRPQKKRWSHLVRRLAARALLGPGLDVESLYGGTLWVVLERRT